MRFILNQRGEFAIFGTHSKRTYCNRKCLETTWNAVMKLDLNFKMKIKVKKRFIKLFLLLHSLPYLQILFRILNFITATVKFTYQIWFPHYIAQIFNFIWKYGDFKWKRKASENVEMKIMDSSYITNNRISAKEQNKTSFY